jgi:hypothetical protein
MGGKISDKKKQSQSTVNVFIEIFFNVGVANN